MATKPTPEEIRAATLNGLIAKRLAAKRDEDAAIAVRRGIDAEIVSMLPVKEEGTSSEKLGDYKVTATFGITRKVDTAALQSEYEDLPDAVIAAFKFEADVKVKELKALSHEDRLKASKFITTKPASPSLKLELA